ncbi:hypothetical protein D3C71_1661150 [compost metagenome]
MHPNARVRPGRALQPSVVRVEVVRIGGHDGRLAGRAGAVLTWDGGDTLQGDPEMSLAHGRHVGHAVGEDLPRDGLPNALPHKLFDEFLRVSG